MTEIRPRSVDELNILLAKNRLLANGKPFRVDHLYQTRAQSRWSHENLQGIYLTNPDYAWMAAWLAMVSRRVPKRSITYHQPDRVTDFIGRVSVYHPGLGQDKVLAETGYLYLFDLIDTEEVIDVRQIAPDAKIFHLLAAGFKPRNQSRNGVESVYYLPPDNKKTMVLIDQWQVAVMNTGDIYPTSEIVLDRSLIGQLSDRVGQARGLSDQEYIR